MLILARPWRFSFLSSLPSWLTTLSGSATRAPPWAASEAASSRSKPQDIPPDQHDRIFSLDHLTEIIGKASRSGSLYADSDPNLAHMAKITVLGLGLGLNYRWNLLQMWNRSIGNADYFQNLTACVEDTCHSQPYSQSPSMQLTPLCNSPPYATHPPMQQVLGLF